MEPSLQESSLSSQVNSSSVSSSQSKKSKQEKDEDIDLHLYIPKQLRHHFRLEYFANYSKEDLIENAESISQSKYSIEEQKESVRYARMARSARLVMAKRKHKTLYNSNVENYISKKMTYNRSIERVNIVFNELKNPSCIKKRKTILQLERLIVNEIEVTLSDCDVYLGILQPKLSEIKYTSVSRHSKMLGKSLLKNNGNEISFKCIENNEVFVVDDVSKDESVVFFTEMNDNCSGKPSGPFGCFPLKCKSRVLGVLALDACRKAKRLRPESMSVNQVSEFLINFGMPELVSSFRKNGINGKELLALTDKSMEGKLGVNRMLTRSKLLELIVELNKGSNLHLPFSPEFFIDDNDTMEYLTDISAAAGSMLDYQRNIEWIQNIENSTQNKFCTGNDVYKVSIQAILTCLLSIETCCIWRVEGKRNVHTLGSCNIPLDRVAPFVNWSERNIKKILLFKEDEYGNGMILKGNISRIIFPDITTGYQSSDWKTSCKYQIKWAGGKTEIVEWPCLNNILAIRPINIENFKVKSAVNRLRLECNFVIDTEDEKSIIFTFKETNRPKRYTYVLYTNFYNHYDPNNGLEFIKTVANKMEISLKCVREREYRNLLRQQSADKVYKLIKKTSVTPSKQTLEGLQIFIDKVGAEILSCLPGCQIAISELQPGCSEMLYTFAYNGSSLLGKKLFAENTSASYMTLNSKKEAVIYPNDGTDFCSLHYFSSKSAEVGDISKWPYIFIPLLHEDSKVGILTINNFSKVEKGRNDEMHPELGVMQYLNRMGSYAASMIRLKRKSHALYLLQESFSNCFVSSLHICYQSSIAIKQCILGCKRIKIQELSIRSRKLRTIFEFYETKGESVFNSKEYQIYEGLHARLGEVSQRTVQQYYNVSQEHASEILSDVSVYARGSSDIRNEMNDLEGILRTFRVGKVEVITLDKKIDDLCNVLIRKNCNNDEIFYQVLHNFSSPDCLFILTVSVSDKNYYFPSDGKFVKKIAEKIDSNLLSITKRDVRISHRIEAQQEFIYKCSLLKKLCRDVKGINLQFKSTDEEMEHEFLPKLQDNAKEAIEGCIPGCTVYIAMYEPFFNLLRYTCASNDSVMTRKRLKRGKGVSFFTLDSGESLIIKGPKDNLPSNGKIRYFIDPSQQKWPVVIVPVTKIGVLCVDNFEMCEKRIEESHPEMGIQDFLEGIGSALGEAINTSRKAFFTARQYQRKVSLVNIYDYCDNISCNSASKSRNSNGNNLLDKIVNEIATTLLGSNAYIGYIKKISQDIEFISCSKGSYMKGNHISFSSTNRSNNASYICFQNQRPTVIPQVEVYHPIYNVIKFETSQTGCLVSVPIPSVGILNVDISSGASFGKYSKQCPEQGVVEWLSAIAKRIGETLRYQRKLESISKLSTIVKGNCTTMEIFFNDLFDLIAFNLPFIYQIEVWSTADCVDHAGTGAFCLSECLFKFVTNYNSFPSNILDLVNTVLISKGSSCVMINEHPEFLFLPVLKKILIFEISSPLQSSYAIEFLDSIVSQISESLANINNRQMASLARTDAKIKIEVLLNSLKDIPSQVGLRKLPQIQSSVVQLLAVSLGVECDCYIGEIQPGEKELIYTSCSEKSLMKGKILCFKSTHEVSLSEKCIKKQNRIIVNNLRNNYRNVLFLTDRKAFRGFVVFPLENIGVLGIDSMDATSITVENELEKDVIVFIEMVCGMLSKTAISVRHKFSYDQIYKVVPRTVAYISKSSYKNATLFAFKEFYAVILAAIKRDLLSVSSQQIVKLADDFTGRYTLLSWQGAPSRRNFNRANHFCWEFECQLDFIKQNIHFDGSMAPMTNLPKALDLARSNGQVSYAVEKRDSLPCLAGLIDGKDCLESDCLCSPYSGNSIAICIYGKKNGTFEKSDLDYFEKLISVVQNSFSQLFYSQLLVNIATQALYLIKERAFGKEACLIGCYPTAKTCDSKSPGVLSTTNSDVFRLGKLVQKKTKSTKKKKVSNEEFWCSVLTFLRTDSQLHVNMKPSTLTNEETSKDLRLEHGTDVDSHEINLFIRLRSIPIINLELVLAVEFGSASNLENIEDLEEEFKNEKAVFDYESNKFLLEFENKNTKTALRDTNDLVYGFPQFIFHFYSEMFQAYCIPVEIEVRKYLTIEDEIVKNTKTTKKPKHTNIKSLDDHIHQRTVLISTMVCCNFKSSTMEESTWKDLLETFLRNHVARKMSKFKPFDKKSWSSVFRSQAYFLKNRISMKDFRSKLSPALNSLLDLILVIISVVKYSKSMHDQEKKWNQYYAKKCIILQSCVRMLIEKRLKRYLLQRTHAAIIIQACYRQRFARQMRLALKQQLAASKIQRSFRRKYSKNRFGNPTAHVMGKFKDLRETFGDVEQVNKRYPDEWSKGGADFKTYEEFSNSKLGKEELKKQMKVMLSQFKDNQKQRAKLEEKERLVEEVEEIFEAYDLEKFGSISRGHTKDMMKRLRIPLAVEELDDVIDMIDSDNSGDISVNEFCNWYKHEYPALHKRSRECGMISKKDRTWLAETLSHRTVERQWKMWNLAKSGKMTE